MPISPAQAAQVTGVSRRTIVRAISTQVLRATRDNRNQWRITPEDLEVWQAAQRAHRASDGHAQDDAHPAHLPAHPIAHPQEVVELAVVRGRLEAVEARARDLEDQLARERERWDRERETILEDKRETVGDLRKRLDRAEERVLALTAQPAQPAPQPTQELPAVVDQLRRRLEASEARNQALVGAPPPTSEAVEESLGMVAELHKRRREAQALVEALEEHPAPQGVQERPSEAPAAGRATNLVRGLLGRLLGR